MTARRIKGSGGVFELGLHGWSGRGDGWGPCRQADACEVGANRGGLRQGRDDAHGSSTTRAFSDVEGEHAAGSDPAGATADHYQHGREQLKAGQYEAALKSFELALQSQPHNVAALDGQGTAYTMLLRPGQALACFRRALALEPESGRLHMRAGNAHMDLTDYASARTAYLQALRLGVRTAKVYFDLGVIAERGGRLSRAKRRFEQAIGVESGFADCHFRLGSVLEKQGRSVEAAMSYLQALRQDSTHVSAHYRLAQHYVARGQAEKARAHLAAFRRLKRSASPQK